MRSKRARVIVGCFIIVLGVAALVYLAVQGSGALLFQVER